MPSSCNEERISDFLFVDPNAQAKAGNYLIQVNELSFFQPRVAEEEDESPNSQVLGSKMSVIVYPSTSR